MVSGRSVAACVWSVDGERVGMVVGELDGGSDGNWVGMSHVACPRVRCLGYVLENWRERVRIMVWDVELAQAMECRKASARANQINWFILLTGLTCCV